MKATQTRLYDTLRRVQNFLDANDAVLTSVNKSATRTELNGVTTQLGAQAGAQAAGKVNAKGESANLRVLRLALRENCMNPIAKIAESKLRDVPQFASLRLPPWSAPAAQLVVHAGAMAQAAQQYVQVFIDGGLAPDFVAKLQAAAAAVQASIDTRAKSIGQRTGATGALKLVDTRARQVLNVLDSLVRPVLAASSGHGALISEWKSIRRVALKSGSVAGSIQAAPPTPPPVVQPVPAPAPALVSPMA